MYSSQRYRSTTATSQPALPRSRPPFGLYILILYIISTAATVKALLAVDEWGASYTQSTHPLLATITIARAPVSEARVALSAAIQEAWLTGTTESNPVQSSKAQGNTMRPVSPNAVCCVVSNLNIRVRLSRHTNTLSKHPTTSKKPILNPSTAPSVKRIPS